MVLSQEMEIIFAIVFIILPRIGHSPMNFEIVSDSSTCTSDFTYVGCV